MGCELSCEMKNLERVYIKSLIVRVFEQVGCSRITFWGDWEALPGGIKVRA